MSERPVGDLEDRIRQQVRMLLDAAKRFDEAGSNESDEALNMAIRLRTLLHSGIHQSALKQGGFLDRMRFTNSVGVAPDDGSLFIGALHQIVNLHPTADEQHVSFKPVFGHHIRKLSPSQQGALILNAPKFEDWWGAIMVRDFEQRGFTREFIIKTVANKDGGAHLDPRLPDDYLTVSRGVTFGISIRLNDGPEHNPGDPVPALVRQITWEFERSLVRTAPELLPG